MYIPEESEGIYRSNTTDIHMHKILVSIEDDIWEMIQAGELKKFGENASEIIRTLTKMGLSERGYLDK